jgi:PKD repeat protein
MPNRIYLILCFLFTIHINVVRGQVVAGFTVDVTAGCVPLVVHFTNTSTGATGYTWDFGNGSNTTAINPSLSYLATGNYTVTLTAYTGTATATYQRVINVYHPPTVNFTADVTAICPGTPVHYNNYTVPGAPGSVSYSWNFGDGGGSIATAPDYAHGLPGFYNINLIATNSAGCTSSLNKPAYVQVYSRPVAAFSVTGSLICHPPATANFTNGSTGLAPLIYSWNFGDGGIATALNPGHSYVADGSYDVSLRVEVHGL